MNTAFKQRVVAKTAAYTVNPSVDRPGTRFTNRGATGSVTFTLPAANAGLIGWWYEFRVFADQTLIVAAAAVNTLVTLGDQTADNVSFGTSGAKIGRGILVECDGTNWFAVPYGALDGFSIDGAEFGVRRMVNLAAATQTLTVAQSGERFVGAVDAVFTLPAASAATKGVWYEFETGALSTGVGLSISPNASDNVRGNGLAADDNKDLINTGATDRLGDSVRIYCDGVTGWVIEAIVGTWAKEA